MNSRPNNNNAINTLHQNYIVKQMNVEVIMAVGERKSVMRSGK